jgi:hypothetical protein
MSGSGRPGGLLKAPSDRRPRGMAATQGFTLALQNPAYRPADAIEGLGRRTCRAPPFWTGRYFRFASVQKNAMNQPTSINAPGRTTAPGFFVSPIGGPDGARDRFWKNELTNSRVRNRPRPSNGGHDASQRSQACADCVNLAAACAHVSAPLPSLPLPIL